MKRLVYIGENQYGIDPKHLVIDTKTGRHIYLWRKQKALELVERGNNL